MFGFLIKKNFCDGWDNLLSVVITNVIYLFLILGAVFINAVARGYVLLEAIAFMLSFVILSIFAFAYGDTAAAIADFKGISYLDYFKAIPGVLKDASLFGVMCSAVIMISGFSIKYYLSQTDSMISFFIGIVILWIDLIFFLSLQWFIPLRSIMHNNFKKCLKKCFLIFFDNTGFSLAMTLYNIILVVFSVAFIGFLPSVSGLLIANTNALRLRLYKYDYLEEHPELVTKKERKNIPWEELIYDDRETLGPRKFKTFLFPWKEEEK